MTLPKRPGKYIERGSEHDEGAFVWTLYGHDDGGGWWRGDERVAASEVPTELWPVYAFSDEDRELLARGAQALAEHLNSWHGGPDEMYKEADQLEALAAHLMVDVTSADDHVPGNEEGTPGKSKQWDEGYRVAYANIIGYLRLTKRTELADELEHVAELE